MARRQTREQVFRTRVSQRTVTDVALNSGSRRNVAASILGRSDGRIYFMPIFVVTRIIQSVVTGCFREYFV